MNTESEPPRVLGAPKNWPDIFINELAETSNVKAAALAASISQSRVYKTIRYSPAAGSKRWPKVTTISKWTCCGGSAPASWKTPIPAAPSASSTSAPRSAA